MKMLKPKIALFILFAVSIMFFSNDFGLIDIEKTAIITAIAIDKTEEGDYLVTCQIAVPEASNATKENQKAQITAKGNTVAGALKTTGSLSGWFPQTIFCNLIIVGNDLTSENLITVLDYFSKTMRVQDSAQVILAEKKAKDLLSATTPLDNISSFAIQKILLKNPGFDQDVRAVDIKTFCVGYYSQNASSYMPMVKLLDLQGKEQSSNGQGEQSGSSGSGGSSEGGNSSDSSGGDSGNKTEGKNLFDATTTALFVKGVKVGELDKELTRTFNFLTKKINGSAFAVKDVSGYNYLLSVLDSENKITVKATEKGLDVCTSINLYCRISDQNTQGSSSSFEKNSAIPDVVKKKAETQIEQSILDLFEVSKTTGCDFLQIKQKLYRFNHKQYSRYKDNYLDALNLTVKVAVNGQR